MRARAADCFADVAGGQPAGKDDAALARDLPAPRPNRSSCRYRRASEDRARRAASWRPLGMRTVAPFSEVATQSSHLDPITLVGFVDRVNLRHANAGALDRARDVLRVGRTNTPTGDHRCGEHARRAARPWSDRCLAGYPATTRTRPHRRRARWPRRDRPTFVTPQNLISVIGPINSASGGAPGSGADRHEPLADQERVVTERTHAARDPPAFSTRFR